MLSKEQRAAGLIEVKREMQSLQAFCNEHFDQKLSALINSWVNREISVIDTFLVPSFSLTPISWRLPISITNGIEKGFNRCEFVGIEYYEKDKSKAQIGFEAHLKRIDSIWKTKVRGVTSTPPNLLI